MRFARNRQIRSHICPNFTLVRSVCPWGGGGGCPMVFFFLKRFTVVFDSKKVFFEFFFSKKKNSKKNFFESKTTVNPLRKKKKHGAKKKPMGQTDLTGTSENIFPIGNLRDSTACSKSNPKPHVWGESIL